MSSPFTLAPDALAPVLHGAIQRLGELGQPGMDALLLWLRDQPECANFDAGFDLLCGWLEQDEAAQGLEVS